jgi:hypothetical protein
MTSTLGKRNGDGEILGVALGNAIPLVPGPAGIAGMNGTYT